MISFLKIIGAFKDLQFPSGVQRRIYTTSAMREFAGWMDGAGWDGWSIKRVLQLSLYLVYIDKGHIY